MNTKKTFGAIGLGLAIAAIVPLLHYTGIPTKPMDEYRINIRTEPYAPPYSDAPQDSVAEDRLASTDALYEQNRGF